MKIYNDRKNKENNNENDIVATITTSLRKNYTTTNDVEIVIKLQKKLICLIMEMEISNIFRIVHIEDFPRGKIWLGLGGGQR